MSSVTTDLAKTSALILLDDYFVIPNAYTVKEDYTLYMVVKNAASTEGMGVIYGDDEGDTIGMCFGDVVYDSSGGIDKAVYATNTLKVRHDGRTGEPASVKTNNTDNGTISYSFPEDYFDEDQGETCQVLLYAETNTLIYICTTELVS